MDGVLWRKHEASASRPGTLGGGGGGGAIAFLGDDKGGVGGYYDGGSPGRNITPWNTFLVVGSGRTGQRAQYGPTMVATEGGGRGEGGRGGGRKRMGGRGASTTFSAGNGEGREVKEGAGATDPSGFLLGVEDGGGEEGAFDDPVEEEMVETRWTWGPDSSSRK
jgi:hypothetical protein